MFWTGVEISQVPICYQRRLQNNKIKRNIILKTNKQTKIRRTKTSEQKEALCLLGIF